MIASDMNEKTVRYYSLKLSAELHSRCVQCNTQKMLDDAERFVHFIDNEDKESSAVKKKDYRR